MLYDPVLEESLSEDPVSESVSESESSSESDEDDSFSSAARRCSMIRRGAFLRCSRIASVKTPKPMLVK